MAKDAEEKVIRYVLQNAVRYKGKANMGAVLGKLLQDEPSLKDNIKSLQKDIQQAIKEVSKLSPEEQEAKLKAMAPEMLEKKKHEKKTGLKDLENTENMVMRFEPSLSGPLHIGHAYAISLNSEYCRKYGGKMLLRLADTNPDNIYAPAYKLLPEDAGWVTGNNIADVIIQSDRMESYYRYAEELIQRGNAYVCECSSENFKETISKKEPCHCRQLAPKEHLARWKKMFKGYKEGDAVVRIKTDVAHENPALRDWPAIRIKETEHPRTKKKYRVWPLLNFAVAIDDHELGITHTVRAKDHIDNERKQKYLYDYLGWNMPKHLYIGRINFEDMRVSCSKTRPLIDNGFYSGWDDIRLPFLAALRRRGYQPDAFIKYAIDVGISQNDKSVSAYDFFKAINHFNRETIDPKANRYFIVKNPVAVDIDGAPARKIEMELHPDFSDRGKRAFRTGSKFYLSREDIEQLKEGELYRLMDCLNFRRKGDKFIFDSAEYETYRQHGKKIIHWLPADDGLSAVSVLMPDNTEAECLGEKGLEKLSEGDIIQAERFGFMRLDRKDKGKLHFWFAHR